MYNIVRDRLKQICPREKVVDLSDLEIMMSCKVAFTIIGYDVKNLDYALDKTKESSDASMLWEFIYDVWRNDE